MKLEIDRQVIVRAAVFTLTLVVPTYIVIEVVNVVADIHENSNFWFLAFLAIFFEMALGGARAARLKPEAPLSHGAIAALAAYVPLLVVVLAIPIAQGHNERLLALIPYLIFALLMFGSSGIFGALVVTSQRERSRARRRRRPPAHRAR
jgi:hypothetical protein